MEKDFFVSPFIASTGRTRSTSATSPTRSSSPSTSARTDDPLLSTSLVLRRRELTDRSLARMLLRYPLVTRKTIGLIHLHALRLWLRGAPFFRHGDVLRAREATR